MTSDLDRRERRELCDLLDRLGPDAPTLCEGWATSDMVAHLAVRERQPLAAPGILLGGPFEAMTERLMARELERHGYAGTVERVRNGPPPGPMRVAAVRYATNLFEMTVHHEDVRRANGHGPRTDRPDLDEAVWRLLRRAARLFVARARLRGARLELDRPGGERIVAGRGDAVAVLTGTAVEVLLYLQGRKGAAQIALSGDEGAVAEVEGATFAI